MNQCLNSILFELYNHNNSLVRPAEILLEDLKTLKNCDGIWMTVQGACGPGRHLASAEGLHALNLNLGDLGRGLTVHRTPAA